MVIKKRQQKRKILRTSSGLLKHNSKKIGFVSTNKLTQESGNVIKKMAARKMGIREKRRMARQHLTKHKKPAEQDEEEDYVEANRQVFEQLQISPEDELLLQQFQSQPKNQKLLDDYQNNLKQVEEDKYKESILNDPKVILVYQDVAQVLQKYRSGKLPQPFHIIPTLLHWKQVLQISKPDQWSPQAIGAAIKIFRSAMDNSQAEYFYNSVLLPAVRASIKTDKKLNLHLYNALIKALYKPQAWFKGILFPLCQAADFTIKEAQIIGSILHKIHIPVIHSAIAIFKVAQFELSGPICIILKVLIEKKYALPEKVLNELIRFFTRYQHDAREMPVIWHQMILRLCELYKLSEEHKSLLRSLVHVKEHHLITPEILKYLSRKMDIEK